MPFTTDARQIRQRREFFRNENSAFGQIANAVWLTCTGWERNTFWMTFLDYLQSDQKRRGKLFRLQYRERRFLKRVQKIIAAQDCEIKAALGEFAERKAGLDKIHGQQIAQEKRAWAALNSKKHTQASLFVNPLNLAYDCHQKVQPKLKRTRKGIQP